MNFSLGLTGSMGMGKSTAANYFAELGCKIWDADATVHKLYDKNGAAVKRIQEICPNVVQYGIVSREILRQEIAKNPNLLNKIELIVHPLVVEDRQNFNQNHKNEVLVFDIPLLFETNAQNEFDAIACVITNKETQKQRILARGNMNESQINTILQKQIPAQEKAARSDYIIRTDTIEMMQQSVQHILNDIRTKRHA